MSKGGKREFATNSEKAEDLSAEVGHAARESLKALNAITWQTWHEIKRG